jgi:hypothetical protein
MEKAENNPAVEFRVAEREVHLYEQIISNNQ